MCPKYAECDYCAWYKDCELQHMGTGSACCEKFLCNAAECNRIECISIEEEMEM